jgi:hypothetical protein
MRLPFQIQLTVMLSGVLVFSAQAQFPYEASVFSADYIELQNPTLLDIELGWDDPAVSISLPFVFPLGDIQANELILGGTGEMLVAIGEIGLANILWPLSLDVIDVSNALTKNPDDVSTIRYQTEGNEPSRIFKMEWNNCGIYEEIEEFGTSEIRVNWQVWLHEASGVIEYRFGPTTMTDGDIVTILQKIPFTSGIILNLDQDSYTGSLYTAYGDANTPSWSLTSDFDTWYYGGESLSSVPQDGLGYRFIAPKPSMAEELEAQVSFQLFPNPASTACGVANHSDKTQQFTCLSPEGKVRSQWTQAPGTTIQLDVSEFVSGFYFIQNDLGFCQKLVIL